MEQNQKAPCPVICTLPYFLLWMNRLQRVYTVKFAKMSSWCSQLEKPTKQNTKVHLHFLSWRLKNENKSQPMCLENLHLPEVNLLFFFNSNSKIKSCCKITAWEVQNVQSPKGWETILSGSNVEACYSRCSLWTGSVAWDLVKNGKSQATIQVYRISMCILTWSSGGLYVH